MSCTSLVGKLFVTIRRAFAVIIFLSLLSTVVLPSYNVSVPISSTENCITAYNTFYIYNTENGIELWNYGSDTLYTIIILAVGSFITLLSTFFVFITIFRRNRARILTFIAFIISVIAVCDIFAIPYGWDENQVYCTVTNGNSTSSITLSQGPQDSFMGDSTNGSSWGPFWGWYILVLGCIANLLIFLLAICSPNPEKKKSNETKPLIEKPLPEFPGSQYQPYTPPPKPITAALVTQPPRESNIQIDETPKMTNEDDKVMNNILKTCPLKKVNETWTNPNTNKETPLLVRGIRLCPYCMALAQVELSLKACKNGECPSCKKWFCLRCLTKVTWAGDHNTCCVLSHPHETKHWCYDKGLQVKNGQSITFQTDFLTENYNFTPNQPSNDDGWD